MTSPFASGFWHCGHCDQFAENIPDDAEGPQKCPRCHKRTVVYYPPIPGYKTFLEEQAKRQQTTPMTTSEQNDAIRLQVESEIPTPIGGFESESLKDDHRAKQDARFLELCRTWNKTKFLVDTITPP